MNKNVKRIFAAAVSAVTLATASFSASAMNLVAPYKYSFNNHDGILDWINKKKANSSETIYGDWYNVGNCNTLNNQRTSNNITVSVNDANELCFKRTVTTDAETHETTYGDIWQTYDGTWGDVLSMQTIEFNHKNYTGLATGKAKYTFDFSIGELWDDDNDGSGFTGTKPTNGWKAYGERAVARYSLQFCADDDTKKTIEMYVRGQTKNQTSDLGGTKMMNTVTLIIPYYDNNTSAWDVKQYEAWIVPNNKHRVEITVDMRSDGAKWTFDLKDLTYNLNPLSINTGKEKANVLNTSNIKGLWPKLTFDLLSNRRDFTLGKIDWQCQRFDVLSTTVDDTTDDDKITANAKIAQDLKWTGWVNSEELIQEKGAEASPLMVLAAYDDNGKMIGATCKTNSEWTNDEEETSTTVPTGDNVTLELNKSDLDGTYSYSKLFIWSTKNELMPYTEAVSTKD